jgi:pilus assembly protein Flp/PilA
MCGQHELGGRSRRLNRLLRIEHQDRVHQLFTEIAVGGQPLSHSRINRKAWAELGLIADESGATAIEYTLIAVLVVMALVTLITAIGDFVSTPFETIAGKL